VDPADEQICQGSETESRSSLQHSAMEESACLHYLWGERQRIGAEVIRRRAITERELALFHQGALPMSEILPLLSEGLLLSYPDESSDAADGHPSPGDLVGEDMLRRIRQKLHRIGRFNGRR